MNDNLLYLDYLNQTVEFTYVNTTPDIAHRNQGNLYGLFIDMNISPTLFLYMMYINGYNSPNEYKGDVITFKKPIRPPIPTT